MGIDAPPDDDDTPLSDADRQEVLDVAEMAQSLIDLAQGVKVAAAGVQTRTPALNALMVLSCAHSLVLQTLLEAGAPREQLAFTTVTGAEFARALKRSGVLLTTAIKDGVQ